MLCNQFSLYSLLSLHPRSYRISARGSFFRIGHFWGQFPLIDRRRVRRRLVADPLPMNPIYPNIYYPMNFKYGTSLGIPPAWAKSRFLNLALPVFPQCQQGGLMEPTKNFQDSEKIASDRFRIGAWILGTQRKRLQVCITPTGVMGVPCSLQNLKTWWVFFLSI